MEWHIIFNVGFLSQVLGVVLSIFFMFTFLQYHFGKASRKLTQAVATGRRLGKFEAFLDEMSQELAGTGNICLIVSLRSKTKLVKEYVRDALVLLAKRQPMLRAVITPSSRSTSAKDRYFEITDGAKIVEMIDFSCSDVRASEWQDVWDEIASKRRGNGLLWQVVLLEEEFLSETEAYANTLIFNFRHTSIDGVSSVKFCKQFLSNLNEVAKGSRSSEEDISSLRLSASLDDLLTHGRAWSIWKFVCRYMGLRYILNFIALGVFRLWLSRRKCHPFFVQFPPSLQPSAFPRPNNMMFKVFSEAETSNIVKVCKQNGSTVTGALMAAAHVIFCKLLQLQDGTKQVQLKHGFSINGQRHCQPKPHEEYLGVFVFAVDSLPLQYVNTEQVDFWKLAQESTRRIHCFVKEAKYVTEFFLMDDVFRAEDLIKLFDRQVLMKSPVSNFVSSAGSFDFGEEQKHHTYRLQEFLFYNLVHGLPGIFDHFNVTVNGKMSWAILYDISRVNREQGEKFANLCFNYFVEIALGEKENT